MNSGQQRHSFISFHPFHSSDDRSSVSDIANGKTFQHVRPYDALVSTTQYTQVYTGIIQILYTKVYKHAGRLSP
jgi:hypothetical protein